MLKSRCREVVHPLARVRSSFDSMDVVRLCSRGLARYPRRMNAQSLKIIIRVGHNPYEVTVYQPSEGEWIAVGEFKGERLEVKGRSDTHVAGVWREAAKHRSQLFNPP